MKNEVAIGFMGKDLRFRFNLNTRDNVNPV